MIFIGRGSLALACLREFVHNDTRIDMVLSGPHFLQAMGSPDQFEAIADHLNIPYFYVDGDFTQLVVNRMRAANSEIGVCLFWPWLLPDQVLRTTRHGYLNLHEGLLPEYRGNAASNWAILNQESEVGYTVHFMEPGQFDSGPVVARRSIQCTEQTRVGDARLFMERTAPQLLGEVVEAIQNGEMPETTNQDPEGAVYRFPRLPRDGNINWDQSNHEVYRHYRSLGPPYDYPYTFLELERIFITSMRISERHPATFQAVPGHILDITGDGSVEVACGRGSVVVESIHLEGLPLEERPSHILRGKRLRLGLDLQAVVRELSVLRSLVGEA